MKKLVFCLTITAFAAFTSLAGEGKDCASACASTKTTKASECSKVAKASECSKSASSCCASKKANATAKGATQLLAKR